MVEFWTAALALTLAFYVILDGFDLGIGILFAVNQSEDRKRLLLASIAPVWDGNETWLVLTASILFGAFPLVYSLLLSAFYIPMFLMLAALIFRGVAFEFREKSRNKRWLWDLGFFLGSLTATFLQGATVGALVTGVPNVDGHFTGGSLGWLSPFSILCGIGLCIGYTLLGAGWLVKKTEGELRELAYSYLLRLLIATLVFLAIAFAYALFADLPVMDRWLERPLLFAFPALGAVGILLMWQGIVYRFDSLPFLGGVVLFLSAFGTLAASFLPYMVPFSITIEQAAAPIESLNFMFWGAGLVVLPLTIFYTVFVYRLFKGKVNLDDHHY